MRRKFARVVTRFGFGGQLLGLAGGELGFRLRDIGARHRADVEALAGLLQRLLEHHGVVALDFNDGRVAQKIHVDGGGAEQHGLFHHAQRLARPRHGSPRHGSCWQSDCQ